MTLVVPGAVEMQTIEQLYLAGKSGKEWGLGERN